MTERIKEILKNDIELSLAGNYKSAYIDGIDKAAADLSAAFEEQINQIQSKITSQFPFDSDIDFVSNLDAQMGANWVCSELTKKLHE